MAVALKLQAPMIEIKSSWTNNSPDWAKFLIKAVMWPLLFALKTGIYSLIAEMLSQNVFLTRVLKYLHVFINNL